MGAPSNRPSARVNILLGKAAGRITLAVAVAVAFDYDAASAVSYWLDVERSLRDLGPTAVDAVVTMASVNQGRIPRGRSST